MQKIKDLYHHCQLEECIKEIENSPDLEVEDFDTYQQLQMQRGICQFELSRFQEGYQTMDSLLLKQKLKRTGMDLTENDLIVQILFFWQVYFENFQKAIKKSVSFLEICNTYREQNEHKSTYNHGVYLFGYGTWNFFEYYYNEDNFECLQPFMTALKQVPECEYQILLSIGWAYTIKLKHKESLEWNLKLFEKCPLFPGVTNNLAISYENLSMTKEAEEYYLKAEQIGPENIVILNNIGQFYSCNNDFEKARKYFEKSKSLNPQYVQTLFYFGLMLIKENKRNEGIKMLKEGIILDRNYSDIYVELAHEAENDDDMQKCMDYMDQCIAVNPEDGQFYSIKGDFYFNISYYTDAIQQFETALSKKTFTSLKCELFQKLGSCFFYLGEHKQSLEHYLKSLQYNLHSIDFTNGIKSIQVIVESSQILTDEEILECFNSFQPFYSFRLKFLIDILENLRVSTYLQKMLIDNISTMQIIAYQKSIQPYLTYQNEVSHWDMYFD